MAISEHSYLYMGHDGFSVGDYLHSTDGHGNLVWVWRMERSFDLADSVPSQPEGVGTLTRRGWYAHLKGCYAHPWACFASAQSAWRSLDPFFRFSIFFESHRQSLPLIIWENIMKKQIAALYVNKPIFSIPMIHSSMYNWSTQLNTRQTERKENWTTPNVQIDRTVSNTQKRSQENHGTWSPVEKQTPLKLTFEWGQKFRLNRIRPTYWYLFACLLSSLLH